MWSIYLIIDLVIVLALLFLMVLSLYQAGYKHSDNRLFAAFSILVATWISANHVSNDINLSPQIALIADYFVFPCSFGAMIVFTYFIVRLSKASRLIKIANMSLAPLWFVAIISATPLVVAGVEKQNNVYAVLFGPLVWLYAVGLFLMVIMTVYAIVHGLKHTQGNRRRQLKIISNGLVASLPLVVIFSFVLPALTGNFSFTEFGISPLIILVASLYYSVVRHGLFDIRLAAVRSAAYVLALMSLSAIYYFLAYVVSTTLFNGEINSSVSISPINILLALLLAFVFQPIKGFFDKITNNIFYRDSYNSNEFFARLSGVLTSTTDLRSLLERAAYEIGTTLKADQAFFFVYHIGEHHISAGTNPHDHLPVKDARELDKYIDTHGDSAIVTDLLADDRGIQHLLLSHNIAVLLPLNRRDNQIIGYLALGEHKASEYTNKDVSVLETISDELVIAIQNSLSVQEVKDINMHLQQRIEAATQELRSSNAQLRHLDTTKDEFLSMASHQLRTPLTSVKGYISMVLEGDAGKITDMQKHLLSEAFTSSERMVRLIHDFLNVSRLQTGKFMLEQHPYDLVNLVKQEVDSLRHTAESRQLKLQFVTKVDKLLLNIDENKIRQVIMNFIDNSLFYSHENTVITIELREANDAVEVTIHDTGIGVPKSEQAQLFSKFYRASNARKQRPDGTGVGLYLAKKVVTAHGGDVLFESKEGKGSTFGFTMPLKKLQVVESTNSAE